MALENTLTDTLCSRGYTYRTGMSFSSWDVALPAPSAHRRVVKDSHVIRQGDEDQADDQ